MGLDVMPGTPGDVLDDDVRIFDELNAHFPELDADIIDLVDPIRELAAAWRQSGSQDLPLDSLLTDEPQDISRLSDADKTVLSASDTLITRLTVLDHYRDRAFEVVDAVRVLATGGELDNEPDVD